MSLRINSAEIDRRIKLLPGSVFDKIHDDVSWNLSRVFLPGFEQKGLNWEDSKFGKSLLKKFIKRGRLPTHGQWEELEKYLGEKDIPLDLIFSFLGMKRATEYIIQRKRGILSPKLEVLHTRDFNVSDLGHKIDRICNMTDLNLRLKGE